MLMSFVLIVSVFGIPLALYSAYSFATTARAFPPRGKFVSAAGVQLHYVEMSPSEPEGATIVLVHGASGNLGDMVESLMPELAKRHRVIAFDRPGHGWSGRPSRNDITDPAAQAQVLHEAIKNLGVTKPVLLGHSWGGAVVTAYALAFPNDLSGLLVMSGATHVWEGKTAWYHKLVRKPLLGEVFLRTLMVPGGKFLSGAGVANNFAPNVAPENYANRIGLPLLFRPANFRANSADSSRLRSYLKEQSKKYRAIKVPTIIITGNRDKTVWAKLHSYALHDEIAGSELIKLVGVGHMPHYVRPDLVTDALTRLALGEVPRAGTHVVEP
ncbi:MAG: alpha/beta hydrolase [Parvibaculum sp.]|nr:alpha/beta hydrolase [Parvibaculum sp.]